MADGKPQRNGIEVGGELGEEPETPESTALDTQTVGEDTEVEDWQQLGELGGDAPATETVADDAEPVEPAGEAEAPDETPSDEGKPSGDETKVGGEEIPPELLRQAQEDLGWDAEMVKGLGAEHVQALLAKHDQRTLGALRTQPPPSGPPTAKPSPTETVERPEPKLDMDALDGDARRQVEAVKEFYAGRDQQREAQREAQEAEWIRQQRETAEKQGRAELVQFDRVLNESEEIATFVGSGNSLDMAEGSPERRWREQIYEQAAAINFTRAQKYLPPLPVDVVTKRAARAVFADQYREIERQKLKKDVADHGKRRTIAPRGQPDSSDVDPEKRSEARIAYFRKTGRAVEHPPGV